MLAPVLAVRIVDRNGKPVGAPPLVRLLTGDMPFLTPGLLTLLGARREESCASTPVPWTPQILQRYIACPLPAETRPGRMVRVELSASIPYGTQPAYGFELATSRFRDAREHLGSGLVNPTEDASGALRGERHLRALGSAAAPSMEWIADLQTRINRRLELRETLAAALVFGPHDAGMTVEDAEAELKEATSELSSLSDAVYTWLDRGGTLTLPREPAPTLAYGGIHGLFETAGLGHRPLPPRAVETLAIETGTGFFVLLESPEPLDWMRITVRSAGTDAVLPVAWSSDGTRAFLFDASPSGLFPAGRHALRVSFHRGGSSAPDLAPLYRNGELSPVEEELIWELGPA
jgi:hypothetical protein